MKRYEGLFILNTAGKEEGVKDVIDLISNEITAAGGKVETIQKMDKRPFSRTANRKFQSGFYVNFIFQSEPATLVTLRGKFRLNDDVFRMVFSTAGATAGSNAGLAAAPAPAGAATGIPA